MAHALGKYTDSLPMPRGDRVAWVWSRWWLLVGWLPAIVADIELTHSLWAFVAMWVLPAFLPWAVAVAFDMRADRRRSI